MTSKHGPQALPSPVEALLEEALHVGEELGADIEAAIREAALTPLDADRAERLYVRILGIVRSAEADELTDEQRSLIIDQIHAEARSLVAAVDRPAIDGGGVALMARNGMPVRDVVPVPTFNGLAIPMVEGYVDVLTLDPWPQNHRVTLYVDEFRDKYYREPVSDELIGILQGTLRLQDGKEDPFDLKPLARSIARKGVERPPIVTHDGEPKDGNRRIAASRLVLDMDEFTIEEKERARWIRVWKAPESITEEQLDAIVVSLNFEEDHKKAWPELVKARLVVDEYRGQVEQEKTVPSEPRRKKIREAVARKFAIKPTEVRRYVSMVQWADDFRDYHIQSGKQPADVNYRTDEVFQWFYEIQAGPTGEKITEQFDQDPEIRAIVYDLMFDETFDSGAQVRAMYQVVGDSEAYSQLSRAHQIRESEPKEAKELIRDAINDARQRRRAAKAIGLDMLSRQMIDRLDGTPASAWQGFDVDLLKDLRRTLTATLGAVEGELVRRGDGVQEML